MSGERVEEGVKNPKKCQVTNYGGISLSIIRISTFYDFENCSDRIKQTMQEYLDIYDVENCLPSKIKAIEYYKRKIDDDYDENVNCSKKRK